MEEIVGVTGEDGEHVSDEGHGPEVPPGAVEAEDSWLGEAEAVQILRYCEAIAGSLGLPTYRWMVGDDPCEEDCHATVSVSSKRYVCVVRVNSLWADYNVKIKVETLAHEVLHAVMSRLDEIWDQTANNEHIAYSQSRVLQRVWTREMELVVDLLTMYMYRVEDLEKHWADAAGSSNDGLSRA